MPLKSIGIIGYGAFGSFLHELIGRLAPQIDVRVFSTRHKLDGKTFFSRENVCTADAVVLAVPIRAFEETLRQILPFVPEHSVIVDVATVKMHTTNLLRSLAENRSYLATHPMFGPRSFSKREGNAKGLRIVVTDHTLPEEDFAVLRSFLTSCGFDVIETTSEKHDLHIAETLFLTHFLGQAVTRSGFTRTEIDSVSFGLLMDAVESVKNDTKLFRDVFRFNPYCQKTLERLLAAGREVRADLKRDS